MAGSEECIFCEIVRAGSEHILKDYGDCVAILDKYPTVKGHSLIVSKEHYPNMLEAPDNIVKSMFVAAKGHGLLLKERLKADGISVDTNIGRAAHQIIFHFHIHVMPRFVGDSFSDKSREITKSERDELFRLLQ
ncbi:MAG: HIT domain-containing protein [Candidatus Micrarchaeota archaeon]|nr:HIT domain-containing protein [Candidatus Micrarchaeota archaeon]